MAISPVGQVGESPQPELSSGDRRSASWTPRTASVVPTANGDVGDRVLVSETARGMAAAAAQVELELHLSPAELRAMIEPKIEDQHLKSKPGTDDSSSNTEERHVR